MGSDTIALNNGDFAMVVQVPDIPDVTCENSGKLLGVDDAINPHANITRHRRVNNHHARAFGGDSTFINKAGRAIRAEHQHPGAGLNGAGIDHHAIHGDVHGQHAVILG